MSVVELRTDRGVARIDPRGGGSIVHLGVGADPADNVLAAYDWRSPLPAGSSSGYGDGAADWLSGYRGGWQLLTPNAGAASEWDGIAHPLHGEVSTANWEVVDHDARSLTMRSGTRNAIEVTRTVTLDPRRSAVEVRTTLANDAAVPASAILVEHAAFAGGEDASVHAPPTSRWRRAGDSVDSAWSEARLGTPIAWGGTALSSLVGGSEGWIELRRPALDRTVRLTWDPATLPSMWLWQERGSTGFPWFGRADIIGLEPASTTEADGLAGAMARDEGWTLEPGARRTVAVEVEIVSTG